MAVDKIRAHHGMCLAYFKGKGYSEEFTEHMWEIKQELEKHPKIRIVNETDDICEHCPNNISGICTSMEQVADYDDKVLEMCGIEAGETVNWETYEALVKNKILDAGKRGTICGNCQWNSLCLP